MFGIGFTELIIILVVALLVVGPDRLPELARQAGKLVRDVKRMYTNLRSELGPEFDEIEQGIRDLRSLDPRQQVRDFGRNMLNDLGTDAPELKQLAQQPKLNLDQMGRDVLRDDLLDKPLNETSANDSQPAPAQAVSPPASTDVYDEHLNVPSMPDRPNPSTTARREIETTGHFE